MERDRAIRTGATASVIAHLSVLALVVLSTEVHPFVSAPESIAVGIVTPQEVAQEEVVQEKVEPQPELPQLPPPDLSLFEQKPPAPAPVPSPAAAQSKPQQMAAAAATPPAGHPDSTPPAAREASAPGYKPAEPDLSIKYNVLLGLPPDLPATAADRGKADEGFDVASRPADVSASVVEEFRRHLKTCSKLPPSVAPSEHVTVKLRVYMTQDGRLAAEPTIGGGSANMKAIELLQNAIAALKACQPYTMLPADRYGEWRVLDLDFTPRDFQPG